MKNELEDTLSSRGYCTKRKREQTSTQTSTSDEESQADIRVSTQGRRH